MRSPKDTPVTEPEIVTEANEDRPVVWTTETPAPATASYPAEQPRCEADYEGGGVCLTPLPTWQSPCPHADRHAH